MWRKMSSKIATTSSGCMQSDSSRLTSSVLAVPFDLDENARDARYTAAAPAVLSMTRLVVDVFIVD